MQRTDAQRKAIELYCRIVAQSLAQEGHTLQDVVAQIRRVEILPTQALIKEIVWNGISKAMLEKPSSTMLEKSEVTLVYEAMNKWLGQTFGIHVPFPTVDHDAPDNVKVINNYTA